MGALIATLININTKKGTQPVTPQGIFPILGDKKEQTSNEMMSVLMSGMGASEVGVKADPLADPLAPSKSIKIKR